MGTISSSIDVWLDAYDHRNRVVGNLTIDRISYISNTPERTIVEYNKLLEETNLLYVHRAEDFIIDKSSGNITRFKNIYGRPVDKIYIDTFANQQKKYKQSYLYKENTIEDTQNIEATKENVNEEIEKIISNAALSGYFEKAIQKYEFTYKCFDAGYELLAGDHTSV